jgi:hypothetical protein
MAQGRIIVNAICADKRISQLSTDTSRLAFTWLITFADCEGRTYGDPAVIRSMIFPRRQDVTIEAMEFFIREWATLGLIVWYECDGDYWISFPKFDKNQPGLRKDREAPSRIPTPPQIDAEGLRSYSGVTPDQLPVKLKEVIVIEGNSGATPAPAYIPQDDEDRIYRAVTNHPTMPGDIAETALARDKIAKIRKASGYDVNATVEYLRPFWKEAHSRYPGSTGLFWLDWAVTGHIPKNKNSKASDASNWQARKQERMLEAMNAAAPNIEEAGI